MNPDLPVMVRTVPDVDRDTWPKGWPLPRIGESVSWPDVSQTYWVHDVAWYPAGEPGDPGPFICIVLKNWPVGR